MKLPEAKIMNITESILMVKDKLNTKFLFLTNSESSDNVKLFVNNY